MAQTFDVNIHEQYVLGMNNKFSPSDLPAGVFSLISNGFVNTNNVEKRAGTVGSSVIVTSGTCLGGSAFEPSGGSKMQIVCYNGASNAQLYKSTNGSTFSAIGSANLTNSLQMNFVEASGYLFGFNGTDEVDVATDGTTVTHNRSGVPIGKFAFWFHNYLFVSGVAGFPNRLYWSALGDPTTFANTDFVDINANDGDFITGLNAFNDELMVGKNNSFWTITGFSGSSFTTATIAGQNTNSRIFGFGTPSHRCMVSAGKQFYYISFVGGIPCIRTLQRSLYGVIIDAGIVSLDIEGTMEALNNTKLVNATAEYDGKFIYFGLPSTNSQVNDTTLVLYPELTRQSPLGTLRSWVLWTGFKPNHFFLSTISGQAKLYFSDGGTIGKVFHFDSSLHTDNGVPVVLTINTRDYMGDQMKQTKFLYYYFKYASGSAGTLQVNARIDEAIDFSPQEPAFSLMGPSPGLGLFILGTSVLGGAFIPTHRVTLLSLTGHLLGVQWIEATENSCSIFDTQVLGSLKGYRLT